MYMLQRWTLTVMVLFCASIGYASGSVMQSASEHVRPVLWKPLPDDAYVRFLGRVGVFSIRSAEIPQYGQYFLSHYHTAEDREEIFSDVPKVPTEMWLTAHGCNAPGCGRWFWGELQEGLLATVARWPAESSPSTAAVYGVSVTQEGLYPVLWMTHHTLSLEVGEQTRALPLLPLDWAAAVPLRTEADLFLANSIQIALAHTVARQRLAFESDDAFTEETHDLLATAERMFPRQTVVERQEFPALWALLIFAVLVFLGESMWVLVQHAALRDSLAAMPAYALRGLFFYTPAQKQRLLVLAQRRSLLRKRLREKHRLLHEARERMRLDKEAMELRRASRAAQLKAAQEEHQQRTGTAPVAMVLSQSQLEAVEVRARQVYEKVTPSLSERQQLELKQLYDAAHEEKKAARRYRKLTYVIEKAEQFAQL